MLSYPSSCTIGGVFIMNDRAIFVPSEILKSVVTAGNASSPRRRINRFSYNRSKRASLRSIIGSERFPTRADHAGGRSARVARFTPCLEPFLRSVLTFSREQRGTGGPTGSRREAPATKRPIKSGMGPAGFEPRSFRSLCSLHSLVRTGRTDEFLLTSFAETRWALPDSNQRSPGVPCPRRVPRPV